MSEDKKKMQGKSDWATDLKHKTRNPSGHTGQNDPNIPSLHAHVQGAGGHWPDTGLEGTLDFP